MAPDARKLPRGGLTDRLAGARAKLRYWARDTFNRDQLALGLRQLAWVAPLTVLIWVYAEREQIPPPEQLPFTIAVRSADPGYVVVLADAGQETITAKLRGAKSQLDRIADRLADTSRPAIELTLPGPLDPGERIVQTAGPVASADLFADAGIAVSDVLPPSIRVRVDRIVKRPAEVVVPPGLTSIAQATFSPPTVEIEGPESVLNAMREGPDDGPGVIRVRADFGAKEAQLSDPGQTVVLQGLSLVPTRVPEWPGAAGRRADVKLSPPTVDATVITKVADRTFTISAVPVWMAGHPPTVEQFRIRFEPALLPNITVRGRPEVIDRVEAGELSMQAVVPVTRDDLVPAKHGVPEDRRVQFLLPPDVALGPEQQPQPTVRMTVDPVDVAP